MSRPIDVEKAVEIIEAKQKELCPVGRYGRNYVYDSDREKYDAWDEIIDVLENLPTLTPQNEWVSVEERLPTDERPVLVFVGYADTMTGFITTSSYFCFDANPHWQWDGLVRDEQRTLFWMPLPAPPDRRPPERQEDA